MCGEAARFSATSIHAMEVMCNCVVVGWWLSAFLPSLSTAQYRLLGVHKVVSCKSTAHGD